MNDPVVEYMALERGLLAHRLTRELAGQPDLPEDPEEERIEREFERVWRRMTPEDRRRLRQARDMRSAPWLGAAVGDLVLVDTPSPLHMGGPPRRRVGVALT